MSNRNGSNFEDPEKRQAILDQAIQVFAEFGFRGTDVQVIADRGWCWQKATVYRYFHNKEELFWATTFEVMQSLRRHLFAAMDSVEGVCNKPSHVIDRLCPSFFEANPQYLEVFVQNRAEFRGAAPESHREYQREMIQEVEKILQEGNRGRAKFCLWDTFQATHAFGSLIYGIVVFGMPFDVGFCQGDWLSIPSRYFCGGFVQILRRTRNLCC